MQDKLLLSCFIFCIAGFGFRESNAISCGFGYVSNGTDCEECGLADYQSNAKIVGGVNANAYSWPSQALLIQNVKQDYTFPDGKRLTVSSSFQCAASLISRFTLISAAHCISKTFTYNYRGVNYEIPTWPSKYFPTFASMFKVYLGVYDTSALSTPPAVEMTIANVTVHPNYNSNNYLNDISILILSKSATFNKYVKPACLPKSADYNIPSANTNVTAIGWGYTSEEGETSNILNNVMLRVYDSSYCKNVLPSLTKNWQAQICSGIFSGGADTCSGDSGGPLFMSDYTTGKLRRVVAGITSYGDGCARAGLPGIYTRTSYYLNWIQANWVTSIGSATVAATTQQTTTAATTKATSTTAATTKATSTTTATTKTTSTTSTSKPTTSTTKTTTKTATSLSTTKSNSSSLSNWFQGFLNLFKGFF